MADQEKSKQYYTYGNTAYQPEELSPAAPSHTGRETEQPRVQPRERVAERPKIEVRSREAISVFAVVGFAAIVVCVFISLFLSTELTMVSDETFDLQTELTELKEEEKKLQTEYDLSYDLTQIEADMVNSGTMTKASSANTVYLDLSEEDSVIYYAQSSAQDSGILARLQDFFQSLVS